MYVFMHQGILGDESFRRASPGAEDALKTEQLRVQAVRRHLLRANCREECPPCSFAAEADNSECTGVKRVWASEVGAYSNLLVMFILLCSWLKLCSLRKTSMKSCAINSIYFIRTVYDAQHCSTEHVLGFTTQR